MGSSTKSLTLRLSLTSDVNWGVNISVACTRDDCLVCALREGMWVGSGGTVAGELLSSSMLPCSARMVCSQRCAKRVRQLPQVSCSSYRVFIDSVMKYQHVHLVIMTPSFCLYCPCIISSIKSGIIDSPFMLMVWIWSVEEQILNHVVFRAWHLKWNEESVRFQSDIRMFLALASVTVLSGATRLYLL